MWPDRYARRFLFSLLQVSCWPLSRRAPPTQECSSNTVRLGFWNTIKQMFDNHQKVSLQLVVYRDTVLFTKSLMSMKREMKMLFHIVPVR